MEDDWVNSTPTKLRLSSSHFAYPPPQSIAKAMPNIRRVAGFVYELDATSHSTDVEINCTACVASAYTTPA